MNPANLVSKEIVEFLKGLTLIPGGLFAWAWPNLMR